MLAKMVKLLHAAFYIKTNRFLSLDIFTPFRKDCSCRNCFMTGRERYIRSKPGGVMSVVRISGMPVITLFLCREQVQDRGETGKEADIRIDKD